MVERSHQEIIINLSNSNGDHIQLDKKELIHYQAYEKVATIVREHVKKIEKYSSTNTSNLSIFIDGTRGAGKSTFLKNLAKELIAINEYKLEKLIYIDPSKIELNEHIFLTLIAQLNQTVIKSRRNINIYHSDEMDAEYELWRKKLKKLAGGLRLLNSGKNPYDLIDDDVFLDWGLDRADDAMQLHSAFVDLIQHACKILNKNALIILIDDADTHFKKGEQVLEMVRRYLDIPQIIVMMAGDLKLYSNVVRGLYLGNMSENLYKYDQTRIKERGDLLDHMEDQYLKKIFPIQNRVSLSPLNKLVKEKKYRVKFSNSENAEVNNITIEDSIDKLIQFGFHIKTYSDIQTYREFLLQQPLRSVIQLLQSSSEIFSKEIDHENFFKLTPQVAQSFRDTFLSSLYAAKVEVEKLNNGDENTLIESVFDIVTEDGGQDTGCYLRPQAIDDNVRNSLVALACSVAEFTQGKASSSINYMLQCSGSVSLFYHIKDELKRYYSDEPLQIRQFKRYCGIGQHEDALNWAWHATAVLMSKKSSASIKAGIIKLKSTPPRNDKDSRNITAYEFIKENRAASLPFNLGLIEVVGNKKQLYFSIFNVLGVMARLLKIGENSIDTSKITSEISDNIDILEVAPRLQENVSNCLRKLETTLGISAPNWSDFSNDAPSELEGKEVDYIDKEYIEEWVSAICKWLIVSHRDLIKIQPSSIFLGKVWIRLYFSLISVADSKDNWNNLGNIISLYTHCLINAFLVEEEDHHFNVSEVDEEVSLAKRLSRQNPKTSFKTVNDKLKQLKNINFEGFPLTRMVANCPIVQGLIMSSKDEYINENTFVSRLPDIISNVSISGIDINDEEDNTLRILTAYRNRLQDNRKQLNELMDLRKSKLYIANEMLEKNIVKRNFVNTDLEVLNKSLLEFDFNSEENSIDEKDKVRMRIANKQEELIELNRIIENIKKDIKMDNGALSELNSSMRSINSEIRELNSQIRELKRHEKIA